MRRSGLCHHVHDSGRHAGRHLHFGLREDGGARQPRKCNERTKRLLKSHRPEFPAFTRNASFFRRALRREDATVDGGRSPRVVQRRRSPRPETRSARYAGVRSAHGTLRRHRAARQALPGGFRCAWQTCARAFRRRLERFGCIPQVFRFDANAVQVVVMRCRPGPAHALLQTLPDRYHQFVDEWPRPAVRGSMNCGARAAAINASMSEV